MKDDEKTIRMNYRRPGEFLSCRGTLAEAQEIADTNRRWVTWGDALISPKDDNAVPRPGAAVLPEGVTEVVYE